jgi:hypothetical protein
MNWQCCLSFLSPTLSQVGFVLLFIIAGIFAILLIKIRYLVLEQLIAAFNPFVWLAMMILKRIWGEPKRYKDARKMKKH